MIKGAGWRRRPDVEARYRVRQPLPPGVMGAVAGAMQEEGWEAVEYHEPARPASRESDVLVPALQSLITGLMAGMVTAAGALAGVVARGWPWWAIPTTGVCVGMLVAAVQWVRLLAETRRLLVKTERWERPSATPELSPPTPGETLRVEVRETGDAGARWTIDELPISRAQLTLLARRVDIGLAKWSRRDLAEIPGIGEERARQALADLETYGYLAYPQGRHHPDGAQPTAKGRALFAGLLAAPPPR